MVFVLLQEIITPILSRLMQLIFSQASERQLRSVLFLMLEVSLPHGMMHKELEQKVLANYVAEKEYIEKYCAKRGKS